MPMKRIFYLRLNRYFTIHILFRTIGVGGPSGEPNVLFIFFCSARRQPTFGVFDTIRKKKNHLQKVFIWKRCNNIRSFGLTIRAENTAEAADLQGTVCHCKCWNAFVVKQDPRKYRTMAGKVWLGKYCYGLCPRPVYSQVRVGRVGVLECGIFWRMEQIVNK